MKEVIIDLVLIGVAILVGYHFGQKARVTESNKYPPDLVNCYEITAIDEQILGWFLRHYPVTDEGVDYLLQKRNEKVKNYEKN